MRLEAHFFNPYVRKDLGPPYTGPVNWKGLREVLRARRTATGESLDDLAARTKINRATIHSIENIKREPDLKPKIETLERLALALDLKMSDLFRQAEGGTSSATPPLHEGHPVPTTDIDLLSRFGTAALATAALARKAAGASEQVREPRRPKTGRSRRSS